MIHGLNTLIRNWCVCINIWSHIHIYFLIKNFFVKNALCVYLSNACIVLSKHPTNPINSVSFQNFLPSLSCRKSSELRLTDGKVYSKRKSKIRRKSENSTKTWRCWRTKMYIHPWKGSWADQSRGARDWIVAEHLSQDSL